MIICVEKNLCFIHIIKTSGSSFTKILKKYALYDDKNVMNPYSWQKYYHIDKLQHSKLYESLNYIKKYPGIRVVTICRNPYDWVGSIWNNYYMNKWENGTLIKKDIKEHHISEYITKISNIFGCQKNYIDCKNTEEKINVDIFKFEDKDCIQKICEKYDLDYEPWTEGLIENTKKSSDRFKMYDYGLDDILLINKLFLSDFEMFGYTMYTNIEEFNDAFLKEATL